MNKKCFHNLNIVMGSFYSFKMYDPNKGDYFFYFSMYSFSKAVGVQIFRQLKLKF